MLELRDAVCRGDNEKLRLILESEEEKKLNGNDGEPGTPKNSFTNVKMKLMIQNLFFIVPRIIFTGTTTGSAASGSARWLC